MSARRTGESGSSYWPTATVTSQSQTESGRGTGGQTGGTTLRGAAEVQWQTPSNPTFTHRRQVGQTERAEELLPAQAENFWTTPQAHDKAGGSPDRVRRHGTKHGDANLADDVTAWHTPRAAADKMGLPREQARDDLQAQAMLWATPTSHPKTHTPRQVDHGEQLANQANQWQTPQSRDWKDGSSTDFPETLRGTPPLGRQALRSGIGGPPSSPGGPNSPRLWPTPDTSEDHHGGRTSRVERTIKRWKQGRQVSVAEAAQLWATPNAADGTGGHHPSEASARRGGNRTLNRNLQEMGYPLRLNPLFVCWLMGFPLFWLELRAPTSWDGGTSARRAVTSGVCKTAPSKSSGSDGTPAAPTDSAPSATPASRRKPPTPS